MLSLPVADDLKSFYFDLEPRNIAPVATQAGVEWKVAAQALRENENDVVDAIRASSL
jgi:NACalpha-BTF3-like transcription factor